MSGSGNLIVRATNVQYCTTFLMTWCALPTPLGDASSLKDAYAARDSVLESHALQPRALKSMLPHAYPAVNARGNSCLHRECLAANLLALLQSLMAAGSFFVIHVCTPIISGLAHEAALILH